MLTDNEKTGKIIYLEIIRVSGNNDEQIKIK